MSSSTKHDAVVILSGGMDSTTALYKTLRDVDVNPLVLSFNYGQRHARELEFAVATAKVFQLTHHVIDLTGVGELLQTSVLTNHEQEVPEGHYAEESMKQTVVPNRNMIMLSIAGGAAVACGALVLVAGMHAGDHPIYPDCRPIFIDALDRALYLGNEGFIARNFSVWAPFLHITKAEIVKEGEQLGVRWDETWSCYKGGMVHCGRCSTCVERLEAFHLAEVPDPTIYEDNTYWRTVVGQA